MKKAVNPRIKEVDALPPGPLWWISRCASLAGMTYTFQRSDTETWFTANRHAAIFWREEIASMYSKEMHQQHAQLIETETLRILGEQQTTLWE